MINPITVGKNKILRFTFKSSKMLDQQLNSLRAVNQMVSVQNPLKPFCCVLGKDTLRHFPLLGGLDKQF